MKRKVRLMQDGTVAADGQDNVGTREAFFQRKVLHPIGAAGFVQVIPHQDGGPCISRSCAARWAVATACSLPGFGEM